MKMTAVAIAINLFLDLNKTSFYRFEITVKHEEQLRLKQYAGRYQDYGDRM